MRRRNRASSTGAAGTTCSLFHSTRIAWSMAAGVIPAGLSAEAQTAPVRKIANRVTEVRFITRSPFGESAQDVLSVRLDEQCDGKFKRLPTLSGSKLPSNAD